MHGAYAIHLQYPFVKYLEGNLLVYWRVDACRLLATGFETKAGCDSKVGPVHVNKPLAISPINGIIPAGLAQQSIGLML
jgi:hypothetical protein